MMLSEIRRVCPDAIILPSDYETYSLFSRRMYSIVRRYTSEVDEYSIDECFADLTGLRRPLKMSYEAMAEAIKHDLDTELGMTFSIGLGPNKVLSKIGSKWKKPSGLTIIPAYSAHEFLAKLPVGKVWGIGPQTSAYLNKLGIVTALDYASKPEEWVKEHMSKPYWEIWRELRGEYVYKLNLEEKHDYQSISKTKTFTPPSSDRDFVYSQLSKNVENACIKARRHSLVARSVYFFLKTQDFHYSGYEISFSNPLSVPQEIMSFIQDNFSRVYKPGILYRSTGIVLMDLTDQNVIQNDLFGSVIQVTKLREVLQAVDALDAKFGKHTVFLGSSFKALHTVQHLEDRGEAARRAVTILKGENKRQRLGIPMLGEVK